MDGISPIKGWVQRLSPSKAKNKPLPQAPPTATAASVFISSENIHARPLKTSSANASPSKHDATKPGKLLSLFGSNSENYSPPATPSLARPLRNQFSFATIRKTATSAIHKSRSRQKSPDLRRLSRKLSDLESQLLRTKQELQSASRHVSRSNSVEREQEADAEKAKRGQQGPSQTKRHYDGLVESLLKRGDWERQRTIRTLTGKSTDDLRALRDQANLEDDTAQQGTEEYQAISPENLKRKRSELRQASWGKIQHRLQEKNVQEQQRHYQVKRTRRGHDNNYKYDKELPAIQKQSPGSTSSLSPSVFIEETQQARPKSNHGLTYEQDGSVEKCLPKPPLGLSEIPRFSPSAQESINWMVFPTLEEKRRTHDHRRHHSMPMDSSITPSLNKTRHRRQQSLVIAKDEAEELVKESKKRTCEESKEEQRIGRQMMKRLPPSPTRSACPSPSRLEPVEEEFEWPEDVF